MQNFATPHSPAQHLPAGWSFPAAAPTAVASSGAPVTGGGAVTATVTRVRWGRMLLMLIGIGLVGVAIWASIATAAKGPSSSAKAIDSIGLARTAEGGGSDDVDLARAARTHALAPKAIAPAPKAAAPNLAARRAAAATRAAAARRAAARTAAARKVAARRAAARTAAVTAAGAGTAALATAPTAAAATVASARTATGGGATAELPYTGAATWIAAIIGIAALTLGILFHFNAVRIGMTAMLYRRGILLRPVDCARLAHRRGIPHARIVLSNVLHRLLEVPATSGEFVSARLA